jgi:DNA-binding transcriptional ArsR family regulator
MLCSCKDSDDPNSCFNDLQKLGTSLENQSNLDKIERFTSAVASKERLIIIKALKDKDRCVCELEVVLDKSQSTISHHLRKLVSAGLIEGYKKNKFTYYHLHREELKLNLEVFNRILNINEG